MATVSMALKARHRRVFDSVFESTNSISLPTPELDFTAEGQPFGGPTVFSHDRSQAPVSDIRDFHLPANASADVRDQVSFDRSWHEVTSHLSLLQEAENFDLERTSPLSNANAFPAPGPGFFPALKIVLQPDVYVPRATQTEDLVSWYSGLVRSHFLNSFLPAVSRSCEGSTPQAVLQFCLEGLSRAHHLYLHGLSFIIKYLDGANPGAFKFVTRRFCRELHAIVNNSLFAKVSRGIEELLIRKTRIVLEIPPLKHGDQTPDERQKSLDPSMREKTRQELLDLVGSLYNVGLGGENLQILFAEVMNRLMSVYIQGTHGRVWSMSGYPEFIHSSDGHQSTQGRFGEMAKPQGGLGLSSSEYLLLPRAANNSTSRRVKDLCDWIENKYSRLAVQVLSKLDKIEVSWSDMEKWKDMSVGRLAGLRTRELFDIVDNWPNSNEGLSDLRTAVTTPQRRLQLTEVFSADLKERLLHPGASTLQILRTYISMIWSFHSLDHSKVLLDRVAYPLQVYLCSREDAVKIVIAGLLSDTKDASGNPLKPSGERLVELAVMLDQGLEKIGRRQDEELDWNDMDWVPDPVDAGPGYRRSKNADVIGTLISVLGSQELFIKEFQNTISESLLKLEGDFEKEVKVLELLKTRFGEAPLQACEVMIKDIRDSRNVDGAIRNSQRLDQSEQEMAKPRGISNIAKEGGSAELARPSVHAKILSRHFWPQLQDESFRVPTDIAKLLQSYESGFELLKNSRKLTWLHALGKAAVELRLLDRTIHEEVHTWQATVIWAFQTDGEDTESPTRSVTELVQFLEMDETLVRNALNFWVGRMVLYEFRRDEYVVLETLDQENLAKSGAQGAVVPENVVEDGAPTVNELASEKMQIYWQFIQGMLTNSSPQMPLQQIAMMLKMLIADGFPYTNEELQEFLNTKVKEGVLDLVAGKYKLKK